MVNKLLIKKRQKVAKYMTKNYSHLRCLDFFRRLAILVNSFIPLPVLIFSWLYLQAIYLDYYEYTDLLQQKIIV